VDEIYSALDHANTDSLLTLVADSLVVYGPRKADGFPTRSDALVELHKLVDVRAKNKPQITSAGLEVVPAEGGHSAWAYDVVQVGAETYSAVVVLSNTDDIWLLSVAEIANTPAMKTVRADLKKDAILPPAMNSTPKIAPAAKAAADKFTRGLINQQVWGDDLVLRSDAVVIGPGKDNVTHGKKEIKSLWKKRMKANVKLVAAAEPSAGTTTDGQLAWVTAPVVHFEDDETPMPMRVFAIFERAGDDWKMLALHEAVALSEPNAGAGFKKIQLPAAPATTPAPADTKTVDQPPKKKKKKKKPPPPPKDDDT
jgi:hypothetical protein